MASPLSSLYKMKRNSLTPIKEESSLSESKKTLSMSIKSNIFEPQYCPCARFFLGKPKGKDPCDDKSYTSILNKPFVFRREESLDTAVKLQERNLMAMYSAMEPTVEEDQWTFTTDLSFESLTSSVTKTTSTPCVPSVHSVTREQQRLEYLVELERKGTEEEEGGKSIPSDEFVETEPHAREVSTDTEAMRLARRYFRIHKIFEFFQFLIAHLLANLPEDPINFLLSLLDNCIIYRAGMGNPPLLYEKRHIEALFKLMDPMRTEYIDLEQYATGMKTLGICSFKRNPPVNKEKMVYKQTFIDEAYEHLLDQLDDILRRRWMNYKVGVSAAPLSTPPPTLTQLTAGGSPKKAFPNIDVAVEDIFFSCGKELKTK